MEGTQSSQAGGPAAGTNLDAAVSNHSSLLARFWSPRYWPAWLFIGWLRLSAALPWRLAIRLNKWLGYLLGLALGSRRRVVLRNLEICFPELSESARRKLATRHFRSVGACFAELGFSWFGSQQRLRKLFSVEGSEHLDAALAEGHGVILYAGHFTTLEICTPLVKTLVPSFAFMFSRRRNPLLDAMQTRGRTRAAHQSFSSTNIRAMLRSLRNNTVVWYAADQAHSGRNSMVLPFFGEPAWTNVATSKLLRISGAKLIPFSFCRRADDSGYILRFSPQLENFPSGDMEADTRRLTAVLEDDIRACPEQYFWSQKRFKGQPRGDVDTYARPERNTGRRAPPPSSRE